MKKKYVLILSVLFISILLVSSAYAFSLANFFKATGNAVSSSANYITATCSDSDTGLDYYTKGDVKICQTKVKQNKTTCKTYSDVCTGKAGYIQEKSCKGKNLATKVYKCPNGCKSGACILLTCKLGENCTLKEGESKTVIGGKINHTIELVGVSSSTSAVIIVDGNRKSVIEGSTYKIGDTEAYVKDLSYLSKRGSISSGIFVLTEIATSCTDSDSGLDYYVKGISFNDSKSVFIYEDQCNINNITLLEYYCTDYALYDSYSSVGAAFAGIIGSNQVLFGKNITLKSITNNILSIQVDNLLFKLSLNQSIDVDNIIITLKSIDLDVGSNDSRWIQLLIADKYLKQDYYTCPNGCKDGACIKTFCAQINNSCCSGNSCSGGGSSCPAGYTYNFTGCDSNCGPVGKCVLISNTTTCTDSDNSGSGPGDSLFSQSRYIKGQCSDSTGTYTDYCDQSNVAEYFCVTGPLNQRGCGSDMGSCPYGCSDGACKSSCLYNNRTIHLTEGEEIKLGEYAFLGPGDSDYNQTRFLRLDDISVTSSSTDYIIFIDVNSGQEFKVTTGSDNHGALAIDGMTFYTGNYTGKITSAFIVWGSGTSDTGNPYTGTHTSVFNCPQILR